MNLGKICSLTANFFANKLSPNLDETTQRVSAPWLKEMVDPGASGTDDLATPAPWNSQTHQTDPIPRFLGVGWGGGY